MASHAEIPDKALDHSACKPEPVANTNRPAPVLTRDAKYVKFSHSFEEGFPAPESARIAMKRWKEATNGLVEFNSKNPGNKIVFRTYKERARGGVIKGTDVYIGYDMLEDDWSVHTILHEIGHILGLNHEHARSDRNLHVEMRWCSMKNNQNNYRTRYRPAPDDIGPYDINSVMHYRLPTFFQYLDKDVEIIPLVVYPSHWDVMAVLCMYGVKAREFMPACRLIPHCPAPYRKRMSETRCVWSCGKGTTPDPESNTCICKKGYAENGIDRHYRLKCAKEGRNDTLYTPKPSSSFL